MKQPTNKTCADCGEPCAVNVDVTHSTFLCNACSGIHREFGDRIKSVSMAQFTPVEIQNLKATSNGKVNEIWMARWREGNDAITSRTDDGRRRRFLTRKYVDREWYASAPPSKTQKLKPGKTEPLVKAPPAQPNSAPPILLQFEDFPPAPTLPTRAVDDLIDLSAIPPPPGPSAAVANERPKQRPNGSIRDDLRSLIDLVPNGRGATLVPAGPCAYRWE
jgi:hypothetical protein